MRLGCSKCTMAAISTQSASSLRGAPDTTSRTRFRFPWIYSARFAPHQCLANRTIPDLFFYLSDLDQCPIRRTRFGNNGVPDQKCFQSLKEVKRDLNNRNRAISSYWNKRCSFQGHPNLCVLSNCILPTRGLVELHQKSKRIDYFIHKISFPNDPTTEKIATQSFLLPFTSLSFSLFRTTQNDAIFSTTRPTCKTLSANLLIGSNQQNSIPIESVD